jgi:predicted RNase H-like nuclease (RuvC/YqgF family)
LIKKIESDQQDEEVIKYTNNKNDAERKIEKLIEDKGALQSQVSQLKKTIEADNQRLQILIKKIEVSEQKRKKLGQSFF